ncbi:MAG TPA: hypothetical protein VJU82_14345 [Acidobacteriaceae bacterium]|nr:hypothetical protein [Acidobacteriaceae bacterium]
MQAPDSQEFQSSLRDVIDWCVTRHRGAVFDSAEAAHRRNLWEIAERLIEEARATPNVAKTEQWKRAQALLSQIRESLGSLRSRFRSRSLMPARAVHEIRSDSDWLQVVLEVANKRSAQNKQNPLEEGHCISADSGQLLVYFPHENLADGAADFSSNSFFDGDNVPPWDLWVSFSKGALISWVPIGLIEAAHMGIDVNPEQCIQWLRQ